jgi:hypothetical protein
MKFLFDSKYVPLTDTISFIKTFVDETIKAFELCNRLLLVFFLLFVILFSAAAQPKSSIVPK